MPHTAVVHGDARCFSVACASIIAKVTRDRVMRALATRYPGYRWQNNVGYATRGHLSGIAELGITPHHRRSFLPVRQLSLDFTPDLGAPPADAAAAVADPMLDVDELARLILEAPPDAAWSAEGDSAP
jgi:hypothetical protein